MAKKKFKRLTTDRLDMVLRMTGVKMEYELVDRIIDIVQVVMEKGGKTSLKDVSDLELMWEDWANNGLEDASAEEFEKLVED